MHIGSGRLGHARVVVSNGNVGDGLAAGLSGKGDEFLKHEVARVLAELVNVGGGEAGGVDGVENCKRGGMVSISILQEGSEEKGRKGEGEKGRGYIYPS